jgi:acetyltransferase-like isoleucine patch superfamily enzyme
MGSLPTTVGKTEHYFYERYCFVDCRGNNLVIDKDANIGVGVKIITTSHDIFDGNFGIINNRPVIIEKNTFIGSFSILYNCTIKEGAIVSIGSVVSGMVVPPYTAVAGNPAKIVAEFIDGRWRLIK